jgi:hypothetical protein
VRTSSFQKNGFPFGSHHQVLPGCECLKTLLESLDKIPGLAARFALIADEDSRYVEVLKRAALQRMALDYKRRR